MLPCPLHVFAVNTRVNSRLPPTPMTATTNATITITITAQNEASHELMEATCALYGLIHARYVLTAAGLEAMYAKYTLQVRWGPRASWRISVLTFLFQSVHGTMAAMQKS